MSSIQIISLLLLILVSATFAGTETAMVSLHNSKVDEMAKQKIHNSRLLKKLKKRPNQLLITILIANNIAVIAASAYASFIFTEMFGSAGIGIATGAMTFLLLIFGEIIPKSYAHSHSTRWSLLMAKPIYIIQILFLPLVWFFTQIAQLTGVKKNFNITEGELVAMLNIASKQGSIPKEEKALIENIFEFDDIEVKDVMTKKDKIDGLEIDMTIKEALKKAKSHTHSKMPVYKKDINNIKGIITITQLLIKKDKYGDKKRLSSLKFGPAIIVKPNNKINLLCNIFLKKKIHIAVVQNNKGETLGVVTLEDLIEEIIGEINDKLI